MDNQIIIKKFDEIDSTNDYLERLLKDNIKNNYIVLSRSQTNGHGSKGRSFISDKNKGIYFSFLIFYDKTKIDNCSFDINDFISYLTPNVCVCIKDNIKKHFNICLDIKWVNDLYYNAKKVVGVLCKNVLDKSALIIGVGIDLYENENLPNELRNKIGYLFDYKIDDDKLFDLILDIYKDIENNLYIGKILDEYFYNNLAIKRQVKINNKIGKVIDINKKAHLLVEIDGEIKEIDSYDVEFL